MNTEASLPKEFEESLRATLGNSFADFQRSLEQPSPISIRLNPYKAFQVNEPAVPWCTQGRYLSKRPVFTLDPTFHAGAYYVQEASSMFLEQAIKQCTDTTKPLRVLDLCAAPGGKSTHLVSLLHPESLLISNEVIRSRASVLSENIQKWGCANVVVTNNDPEDFTSLEGFFDVIVVDAPCSGEGLFRKDPEAMKEWSPANVELCSKRQRRILADVWPALKRNGLLIYSTCTYNHVENEENVQWLSTAHTVESVSLAIDPAWGIETTRTNTITGYRFYPHKLRGEGFFLSVVRKTETQSECRFKSKKLLTPPQKNIIEQLNGWINPSGLRYHQWNETLYTTLDSQTEAIEQIIQKLRIVSIGTALATAKHTKLIPEHSLALSIKLNQKNFQLIDVALEDALHYLRKEPIQISSELKGFALITYRQLPLGWVNVLENRMNNLYPKEWRIRMT